MQVANAFSFLIDQLFDLYIMVVLLRFLLQWAKADFYNPISQFVVRATNPLLRPMRRIIPGWGGFDWAALVLALLLLIVKIALLFGISAGTAEIEARGGWGALIFPLIVTSSIQLLIKILWIFYIAIIATVILSWVAPMSHNPAVGLLHQLTEPVMAPFRRLIPPMGGLDLSPIVVLLLIHFLIKLLGG